MGWIEKNKKAIYSKPYRQYEGIKMEKLYAGKPPIGDEWRFVSDVKSEGIDWNLYKKDQPHDPHWKTYKICAVGKAPRKANYWLARNDETGQIGFAKDYAIMRDKRPDLHEQIEKVLKQQ